MTLLLRVYWGKRAASSEGMMRLLDFPDFTPTQNGGVTQAFDCPSSGLNRD